ncbi:MAG: amino acid-binding protein [Euryarchaeota archaeon]|nr:amino acid-binding protein [Euryarchaeota archaeon]
MWAALIDYFQRYPAQEKIARLLIRNGLSIREGKVYSGEVELADSALGRAAGVDRRIVAATVRTIEANAALHRVFANFQPTLHLKEVAPALGWGVIEIVPDNASRPGILAGVSSVISREGISIRQAVVDDPDFSDAPRLFIVTERPVPAGLIPEMQKVAGVKSVTVS